MNKSFYQDHVCTDSEISYGLRGIPEGIIWFNLLWHWQDVTSLCLTVQGGNYSTEWKFLIGVGCSPRTSWACSARKQDRISLWHDWVIRRVTWRTCFLIASSDSFIIAQYLGAVTGPCRSIREISKTPIAWDCCAFSSRRNLIPITLELDSESN